MAPTEVLAAQYARSVGPLLDAAGVTLGAAHRLDAGRPSARRILRRRSPTATLTVAVRHARARSQEASRSRTSRSRSSTSSTASASSQRLGLRGEGRDGGPARDDGHAHPALASRSRSTATSTRAYLRERPGGRDLATHVTHRDRAPRRGASARTSACARRPRRAGRRTSCARSWTSPTTPRRRPRPREAERLRKKVFPDLRVGLLTGQMKPAEKAAAMDAVPRRRDRRARRDHRHRGRRRRPERHRHDRRGRRALRPRAAPPAARPHRPRRAPGEFLLFADPKTAEGRERMEAIAATDDGFALAEAGPASCAARGRCSASGSTGCPSCGSRPSPRDADLLDGGPRGRARRSSPRTRASSGRSTGRCCARCARRFADAWEWVSSGMRIVAGEWRGRRIVAPAGRGHAPDVRPRARGALLLARLAARAGPRRRRACSTRSRAAARSASRRCRAARRSATFVEERPRARATRCAANVAALGRGRAVAHRRR